MKLDQQQQAQRLYFQANLTKTEIAETLGISRRALHNWIRENNWEQIKKNGENIPAFLAENCYQVLGNLTGHLLSADRIGQPATMQEVNAICKLTLAINRLKKKNTLNESMETLARFMDSVNEQDPALAQQVQPLIDYYITTCAAQTSKQYWQSKIAAIDRNTQSAEKASEEAQLDLEDFAVFADEEKANAAASGPHPAATPTARPGTKPDTVGSGSLRHILRGTATTGPSKVLKKNAA